MRRLFVVLLITCVFPVRAMGESSSLSLKEALEMAHSLAPNVVLARQDTAISQAERLKANRYPNPEAEFNIGPNFETLDEGGTKQGLYVSGSINQEIELWGKRKLRKQIADDQISLSTIQELITTNDVDEKIKILYAAIQRAEEKIILAQANIDIAKRFVGTAQMKFEQNEAPHADVLRAKMELARQQKSLVEEQNDLAVFQQQMNLILARDLDISFKASDPFQVTSAPPPLEELIATAAQRPEVQSVEVQKKQNEKEIQLANQEWKPNLKTSLWAEKDSPDTHFGPGVGMEIPLWYRNKGDVQAAKARQLKIAFQETYLGREIELEVRNKYLELRKIIQSLQVQKETIQNTGELFRTTFQGYLEGKTDFLRFVETLQSVNAFKSEYYDTIFEYFVKKAEVERAVGGSL